MLSSFSGLPKFKQFVIFDGLVPENNGLNDTDLKVLKKTYEYPELISKSLDNFKFREAVSQLIDLSRLGNKYLAEEEPWKLHKAGELKRVEQIIFVSLQVCGMLAILSHPFLPNASKKLKRLLI